MTEFGAQGLELDAVLLAWGTDLQMHNAKWSNHRARGYKRGAKVRDPYQSRLNHASSHLSIRHASCTRHPCICDQR